jgi:transcriptional regulator with XRE-family HTH domain
MSEATFPRPDSTDFTPEQLWRDALGAQLRRMRFERGERLDETAKRAGISPQYLSEVERGRKDASSEMISAILGALDSSLVEALSRITHEFVATPRRVVDIRSVRERGAESRSSWPAGPAVSLAA